MKYYLVYKGHDLPLKNTTALDFPSDIETLEIKEAELLKSVFQRMGFIFELVEVDSNISTPIKQTDRKLVEDFGGLTNREIEVCRLICFGIHPKHIASTLDMMPKTVSVHRSNIYRKIGVSSPIALLRQALKAGFVKAAELVEFEG
ncbi:response regulator (activator) in two-component regulatory system wtih UhpB [Catenovulum agarivorans DS-2]|uniref:Response regulator (Activator) in two-component regulatory system wtih UhpB n=1 Tax=Catenovulum agarivorans DS-2 TaxID=1328313 RepID=W7QLM4_9ALTE|nr:LuxR C-terminal-related transcriptional regulator [Catenovulum agarivorans]EWH09028.1 response regulator (activator) in two-component regulatory system wtih UhpB [Catenovulum agarivorans DS-2]